MAKLDFRLVDGLTPSWPSELLRQHLDRRGFTDISITLLGGEEFAASPPGSLVERAAVAASQDTWNKQPVVFPWYAGSGPMYPLSTMLDLPLIFAGRPGTRMRAPIRPTKTFSSRTISIRCALRRRLWRVSPC